MNNEVTSETPQVQECDDRRQYFGFDRQTAEIVDLGLHLDQLLAEQEAALRSSSIRYVHDEPFWKMLALEAETVYCDFQHHRYRICYNNGKLEAKPAHV